MPPRCRTQSPPSIDACPNHYNTQPSSNIVANDLFLSSDSEVESPAPAAAPTPARQEKKRKSCKPVEKPAVKKPKIHIAPIKPPARITAQDLFNSGSEEEDSVAQPSSSKPGKLVPPIYSYLTRRESKGYSRRTMEKQQGKYYVEVKIYDTEEIKKIQPINRWRYAITTVKTKLNEDSRSWQHIKEFIREANKDFKSCPPSLLGMYEN
ncbi:hypothetical protein ACJJTC_002858 [Scirpophaga incertulas]